MGENMTAQKIVISFYSMIDRVYFSLSKTERKKVVGGMLGGKSLKTIENYRKKCSAPPKVIDRMKQLIKAAQYEKDSTTDLTLLDFIWHVRAIKERAIRPWVIEKERVAQLPPHWRVFSETMDDGAWTYAYKFGMAIIDDPPKLFPKRLWPYLLNDVGVSALKLGRYIQCPELFSEALDCCVPEDKPLPEIIHSNMALALIRVGNVSESRNSINKALELDSNCLLALYNAITVENHAENFDQADVYCKRLAMRAETLGKLALVELQLWLHTKEELEFELANIKNRAAFKKLVNVVNTLVVMEKKAA